MEAQEILRELKARSVPHQEIADAIGRERSAATKMIQGVRRVQVDEIPKLVELLKKYPSHVEHMGNTPDLPVMDPQIAYLPIPVLPTYAGMGGGGSGDSDQKTALLPRYLVEDELHARPEDLLLINVRGDSMMDPATGRGFLHGDQLLVDKRDRNPVQPGPFALWFDDGYVVKNVERIRSTGRLRIFSNNPAYSPDEVGPEDVSIMGRPVWVARRL
jgi:SOS-response transcriptional repressor LexA